MLQHLFPLILLAALGLMFSIGQTYTPDVFGPPAQVLDNLILAVLFGSPIGLVYLVIVGIVHRSRRRPVAV